MAQIEDTLIQLEKSIQLLATKVTDGGAVASNCAKSAHHLAQAHALLNGKEEPAPVSFSA